MSDLKLSRNTKKADWLGDFLNAGNKPNFINGLIPNSYQFYFKLFFSVGLLEGEEPVPTSYRELASLANLKFKKSLSYTDFVEKFGGMPEDFVVLKEKDESIIENLIEILDGKTVCVFHGFGDDILPEKFEQPWIITDRLSVLKELFRELNAGNYHDFSLFPEYIFPEDRSWCIGNLIFQSGLIVIGCNTIVAEKIRNQNYIENVELGYDDEYFTFLKSD